MYNHPIGSIYHLYTTYILPSGELYATYHLLWEPETTIVSFNSRGIEVSPSERAHALNFWIIYGHLQSQLPRDTCQLRKNAKNSPAKRNIAFFSISKKPPTRGWWPVWLLSHDQLESPTAWSSRTKSSSNPRVSTKTHRDGGDFRLTFQHEKD